MLIKSILKQFYESVVTSYILGWQKLNPPIKPPRQITLSYNKAFKLSEATFYPGREEQGFNFQKLDVNNLEKQRLDFFRRPLNPQNIFCSNKRY